MHVKRREFGRLENGLMTQLMTRIFANPYNSRGLGHVSRGSSPVSRTHTSLENIEFSGLFYVSLSAPPWVNEKK